MQEEQVLKKVFINRLIIMVLNGEQTEAEVSLMTIFLERRYMQTGQLLSEPGVFLREHWFRVMKQTAILIFMLRSHKAYPTDIYIASKVLLPVAIQTEEPEYILPAIILHKLKEETVI